ncbi:MAG: cytochrome c [bacterium]|nr:cytochrome c [bacterium]
MTRFSSGLMLTIAACLLMGCGDDAPSEAEMKNAALASGGQLYDGFWKMSSAAEPADTHPLWAKRPDAESNTRTGSTTWRCKECHGWDYKGVEGAYAKGSHRTGFAGVFGTKLTKAEIVTSLADAHGYRAAGLGDAELENLALFVGTGLEDSAKWIDAKGAFRGDVKRGQTLYTKGLGTSKSCSACHGLDGLKAPKRTNPDYDDFVGKVAAKNPWEFLHKVRFGQPGTKMPAAVRGGVSIQDVIDLSAYAQTLPKAK